MTDVRQPLADKQARDEISTNFAQNMLVEAGAGSGKTTSLTERMVEAVAQGHVKVEHMAAITFTRKAAYQLKEKFQEVLEKKRQDEKDPARAARMEEALTRLALCFIGTIHSFCAAMLRERPVEAGINPDFTELDDVADQQAQDQAWEMLLKTLAIDQPELLDKLAAIGVDPMSLKSAAKVCMAFPEVRIHTAIVEKPDIDTLKQQIIDFVGDIEPLLPVSEPEKGWDTLQDTVLKARGMLQHFDLTSDASVMDLAALFDKNLGVTLNRWPDPGEAKILRDETAPTFVNTVIRPAISQWQAYCHPLITELVEEGAAYYSQLRRQRGWVNFQDLLLTTTAMLRENPEVRQHFSGKYQCILVDEFQDTDPVQAEMLLFLTGTDWEEKDWTALRPRPGSLFLVGDPKQSIYRFRRADIDTYHQVKRIIENTGGKVLKLTSNFRSLHALSRHINPLFEKLLPERDTPEQAAYAPMLTQQEGDEPSLQGVLRNPVSPDFQRKDDIIAEDARRIAALIRQWVDKGQAIGTSEKAAAYGDFLILTRYRDGLSAYTSHLEARGIPYRVTGSSVFGELPEIQESITLLQYLAQPGNEILGVAVLRGLFFGCSDQELYQHRQQQGSFRLFGRQPEENELQPAFQRLQQWHSALGHQPLSVVLEQILDDTDLLPTAWMEEGGRVRCGHLIYLLEFIKQEEASGNTTVQGILEKVQNLAERGVEEELDITGEEDVVRVMNLHKAKGLESSVVFLAQPYKLVSWPPEYHIQRQGKDVVGHFVYTVPKGSFGSKTLGKAIGWEQWEGVEAAFLDAEEDRLLYVAATRAKHLLVVSSAFKNNKNPWSRLLNNLGEDQVVQVAEADAEVTRELSAREVTSSEVADDKATITFEPAEPAPWVESLSKATYQRKTPTDADEKKLEEMWQVEREVGGGKAWGTVVHKLLEYLVKHRKEMTLESVTSLPMVQWLEEEALSEEAVPELIQLGKKMINSALWQRLIQADRVYEEVPFHLWVTETHPLAAMMPETSTYPVYYAGVIDLVFREGKDWVIADYKTDRPKDPSGYLMLENLYQKQLNQYKVVWEHITGEKVKETQVYFLYQ